MRHIVLDIIPAQTILIGVALLLMFPVGNGAQANSWIANMKHEIADIPQLSPGQPAPDFLATDSTGKQHKLSALRGKIVVLEWTNDQCPYVHKFYDSNAMQTMQQKAMAQGIVWFTVVSSAQNREGYTDAAGANRVIDRIHSHEAGRLLDPTGTLGRLYGAITTPQIVIVDRKGLVAYDGAVDNNPSVGSESLKGATNYVTTALADLTAGRPVAHPHIKPYGCAVKYDFTQ